MVENYLNQTRTPFLVLLDPTRGLYRAYDFDQAGFWDLWGWHTWRAYYRALRRGGRLWRPGGDISQRGGNVVIDPEGMIRMHRICDGPGDRPRISEIEAVMTNPMATG